MIKTFMAWTGRSLLAAGLLLLTPAADLLPVDILGTVSFLLNLGKEPDHAYYRIVQDTNSGLTVISVIALAMCGVGVALLASVRCMRARGPDRSRAP